MLELKVSGTLLNTSDIHFTNLSPILHQFAAYMVRQTDRVFEEAGTPGSGQAGGVSSRGVTWEPFTKRYRKRPSGRRVTPLSALLHDTGTLRKLAATEITTVTPTSLIMGTRLPYAAAQNAKRPFLFLVERDADVLMDMLSRHYGLE